MEQLVILLLIVTISLINWIIQKSKETREKRKLEKRADATGEGLEPPPASQTETAMRRLREALGLPEEAEPPVIPKRVERPAKPKKAERETPPRPAEPTAPPPLPRTERKPIVAEAPPARPRIQRHFSLDLPHRRQKTTPKVSNEPGPRSRIRELLGSPGGLRDAVVLSEILGPPKGVREGRSLL